MFTADRWHSSQNLVQLVHLDPAMTWLLTLVAVLMLRFYLVITPWPRFPSSQRPIYPSRTRICATRELQAPHAGLSIKWHEQTINRLHSVVLLSLLTHRPLCNVNECVCLELTTTTILLLFTRSLAHSLAHLILIGILHQISNMLITSFANQAKRFTRPTAVVWNKYLNENVLFDQIVENRKLESLPKNILVEWNSA